MSSFESKLTRNEEELDKLGMYLYSQFTEVEKRRRAKELEWISNLRQIKGIYPPEVLNNIPEDCSKVFIKYTKAKERYIRSKINSIVFPEKGKAWSIKPTPVPDAPEEVLNEATAILQRKYLIKAQKIALESGQPVPPQAVTPDKDEVLNTVRQIIRKRAKRLEKTLNDQLIEANYEDVLKEVIKSGIRYGTGIWKGPMSFKDKNTELVFEDGRVIKANTFVYKPALRFVPIWNFYPDMSVTDPKDMSFIFELHCLTKKDLIQLSKQKGFFKDVIQKYINEHPTGDYAMKNWETHLMSIDDYQGKVNSDEKPMVKAYQVLEYWGYIDGTYFKYAGVEGADELDDYEVYEARVWILGSKIIKISLNPLPYAPHPYNIFYFEKDETSIFGTGLPPIINGTQEVINASARMMLDNAAIVAGPQMEVNIDLLEQNQDLTSVHPRKIWYRSGIGIDAQYPAIRSINLDSHLPEYINILEVFRKLGDEESSLPSVLWTNLQSNETARGVLIRYKTAHITLMDIVKELDKAIERFLRAMVRWNYEFNDDPEIKGDYKIEAKGTDTLLETEAKLEGLVNFMQTMTEADEPYIRRKELLEERVKLFGLDPDVLVRTEEEAQEFIAQQQQQLEQLQQLQAQMLSAKTEYERAKAANMLAKSKKSLTEEDLLKKQFLKGVLDDAEQKARELVNEGNPEEIPGFTMPANKGKTTG